MKSLFLIIMLTVLGLSSFAQSQCDFLKNLKFRNGRDTIMVKAILDAMVQAPPPIIYKGKKPSIYKYKSYSQISFKPENCSEIFTIPISSKADADYLYKSNGETIYLTCIAFNEHITNMRDPDCIVIRVSLKKPTISK